MRNFGLQLRGDWRYAYVLGLRITAIKDRGIIDVNASGIAVSINVTIDQDKATGKMKITAPTCLSQFTELEIKVRGGEAWLYDLFTERVSEPLRNDLKRIICETTRKAINEEGQAQLETAPFDVVLDGGWTFDYSLAAPPTFETDYFETYHRADFGHVSTGAIPFPRPPITTDEKTTRMVSIWISDYVPNLAIYVLFGRGLLTFTITKALLPPNSRGFLETSTTRPGAFGTLIPQLGQMYPGSSIEIEMLATECPSIAISPTGIVARFPGRFNYRARQPNGNLADLFATKFDVNLELIVFIEDAVIKTAVLKFDPQLEVVDNRIGVIPYLIKLLFGVIRTIVIRVLNNFGGVGFPLPTVDAVEFVNTKLVLGQGHICVMTDMEFKSHKRTMMSRLSRMSRRMTITPRRRNIEPGRASQRQSVWYVSGRQSTWQ